MLGQGTCRDEILAAVARITGDTGRETFTLPELVDHLRRHGTRYRDSTIRTHVASRLCVDAPDHHAVRYPDFERVGPGLYKRRTSH